MITNSWKLNDSKTQVIAFGSVQQLKTIELHALRIGECLVTVTHSVHNLGTSLVPR